VTAASRASCCAASSIGGLLQVDGLELHRLELERGRVDLGAPVAAHDAQGVEHHQPDQEHDPDRAAEGPALCRPLGGLQRGELLLRGGGGARVEREPADLDHVTAGGVQAGGRGHQLLHGCGGDLRVGAGVEDDRDRQPLHGARRRDACSVVLPTA
jgi:hypothetical protein